MAKRKLFRRAFSFVAAVLGLGVAAAVMLYLHDPRDTILERAESRGIVEADELPVDGAYERQVQLTSTTGLEVALFVRRPQGAGPFPVCVIAHDPAPPRAWLPEDERCVVAVIESPLHRPLLDQTSFTRLREEALKTPAAILMALDYLCEQEWADETRVLLAGSELSSYSVPIAAALARATPRTARLEDRAPSEMLELRGAPSPAWIGALFAFGGGLSPERWRERVEVPPIDTSAIRPMPGEPRGELLRRKLEAALDDWLGRND